MRHLVCLATWPSGADGPRGRSKILAIVFSQRIAAQPGPILFH